MEKKTDKVTEAKTGVKAGWRFNVKKIAMAIDVNTDKLRALRVNPRLISGFGG